MNRFLNRLARFFSIFFLLAGINLGINLLFIMNASAPLPDSNILIMGDSHSRKALHPDLFPSASNVSQQGEPYIISFWKLKYLAERVYFDTLLLSFSHHNLSEVSELKFSHKRWSSKMFERTYLIGDFNKLQKVEVDRMKLYSEYFKNMCLFPRSGHDSFIGNYSNLSISDVSDAEKVSERHYYFEGKDFGVSDVETAYLDSIIGFCDQKNIELVLIGTPVHDRYFKLIPPRFKKAFDALKDSLTAEGVRVSDYSMNDYPAELFLNSNHLNAKGAVKFTSHVYNDLRGQVPGIGEN